MLQEPTVYYNALWNVVVKYPPPKRRGKGSRVMRKGDKVPSASLASHSPPLDVIPCFQAH